MSGKSKKNVLIFIVIIILILILIIFITSNKKTNLITIENSTKENTTYNSNIIKDVNYVSKDMKGNIYTIDASEGVIDLSNSNIIFLTDVRANIKLNNSKVVKITSKYGKYNTENYDTIFSKDVIINYIENQITSEYLDFSIDRNTMIISRNVIHTNDKNILEADVIEMDIQTKDTKIFMYNSKKKVNIKSKN
jgi:LPS export ABC transporter protein LptC